MKTVGPKPNLFTIIKLYLLTDQALLCPVGRNPYPHATRLDMEFQAGLITCICVHITAELLSL